MAADGTHGTALRVRVPAKLNLYLAVRGRRADGFHDLVTVFQTVSLYDQLRIALLGLPGRRHHPAARSRMRVELWADPAVPQGRDNLALQAALRLGRLSGIVPAAGGVERDAVRTVIDLDKQIPMTAGMAGGSADAAAVLVALNRLWRCGLTVEQLREVAADSRPLGAEIGVLSILHTWGQTVVRHPHVHCVVPAGGLSPDHQRWIRPKYEGFFLPVKVLSRVFRGKFVAALRHAYDQHELDLAKLRYNEEIVPESLATGRPPSAPVRCARLVSPVASIVRPPSNTPP